MAQGGQKQIAPTPGSDGGSRLFLLALGAIVVIGLGAVAVVATTRDGTSGDSSLATDGAETAAIDVAGASLLPLPDGVRVSDATTDPEYGAVAPTLTGTAFDGSEVVIGPDGSAKVISFLAHWCPHCQEELPLIQNLIDEGNLPDGLEVYGVSTSVNSGNGNFPPSAWFDREGFTPIVVRDDDQSSALTSFGASSFPFAVYLDSEHRIVARSGGGLDPATTQELWQAAVS